MSTRLKHSPTLLSGAQAPFVALESTVISHGLPYPANLETALRLEEVVRAQGAIPATVGIISGEVVVGLDRGQIEDLATAKGSSRFHGATSRSLWHAGWTAPPPWRRPPGRRTRPESAYSPRAASGSAPKRIAD